MECDIFLNCDSVTVTVEGYLLHYKAYTLICTTFLHY